ncbi:MAG TPA: hypothetical protein VHQ21_08880 [Rhodanobacteraceae bacterium]|jgi:hypothetical protein|nr:hypothetical protein [Rhodanobacteraceae bacterium]
MDPIEQVFRHDLDKTAVAVLDRLVARENVVDLAVIESATTGACLCPLEAIEGADIVMQPQPGHSNEVLDSRQLP